ncbi:hypothetical protein OM416_20055 [Paenibacillus sp. LS1]|nr:hypothetical protein [Paenibacillus sp. LS1]
MHDEIRRLIGINTSISPGQHIVITANTNHHEFEFGQHCVVTEWEIYDEAERDVGVEAMPVNGGQHWFVNHTDYDVKI